MEDLADAILALQAGQIAQTRMLRALIASHPAPEALRLAWEAFAIPTLTANAVHRIGGTRPPKIHDAVETAMREWSERLAADLPPREPRRD
jgi:hypothetical protein